MLGWKKWKSCTAIECRRTSNYYVGATRKKRTAGNGVILETTSEYLSRELARDLGAESGYVAALAGEQASQLRLKPRKALELVVGNPLFEVVEGHLKKMGRPNKSQALTHAPRQARTRNPCRGAQSIGKPI